jgi:hypothetical protein
VVEDAWSKMRFRSIRKTGDLQFVPSIKTCGTGVRFIHQSMRGEEKCALMLSSRGRRLATKTS